MEINNYQKNEDIGYAFLADLLERSQEIACLKVFCYQQKAADALLNESGIIRHTVNRW